MFQHRPEVYKSLNSSDDDAESEQLLHHNYECSDTYQYYTKTQENAVLSFINLLIESTGLSHEICDNIISYLSLPYRGFIFFNPFNHDGLYSMLDFGLLLFSNTVHYIICIALLLHTYSSTWLTFTCFSFIESLIITIFYWYTYFYGYLSSNTSNVNDQFIIFYASLHLLLIFLIDIPMIMILLYFYYQLFMAEIIIYSISFLICMAYKYIIYHQRINYTQYEYIHGAGHTYSQGTERRFKNNLNIFPFNLIVLIIIFLYGVLTSNIICMIISGFLYYFAIFIINYIDWKNNKLNAENTLMKNSLCIVTYFILCFYNCLFMIFSINVYNCCYYLGIVAIVFGIFQAFIIFIYYIFFNIIYCVFHDNEKTIGEYEYTLYDGGKYKKFADFFNYLYLTLELCINIPICIILLFYMYNENHNVVVANLYISWYFVVIIYIVHDAYSIALNFYYTPKRADLHLFYYRILVFIIKLPFILLAFGIIYLTISYINNIGPSFNQIISFIFLIYSSLYFTCLVPICVIKSRSLTY